MMTLNLNEYAIFTLTERGRTVWREHVRRQNEMMLAALPAWESMHTGDELVVKMPIWQFIHTFGAPGNWIMGSENVCCMDIQVCRPDAPKGSTPSTELMQLLAPALPPPLYRDLGGILWTASQHPVSLGDFPTCHAPPFALRCPRPTADYPAAGFIPGAAAAVPETRRWTVEQRQRYLATDFTTGEPRACPRSFRSPSRPAPWHFCATENQPALPSWSLSASSPSSGSQSPSSPAGRERSRSSSGKGGHPKTAHSPAPTALRPAACAIVACLRPTSLAPSASLASSSTPYSSASASPSDKFNFYHSHTARRSCYAYFPTRDAFCTSLGLTPQAGAGSFSITKELP